MTANIYDFTVDDIGGNAVCLDKYRGNVVLVSLYETNKDKNFSIIAFPCNQFGGQEPLSNPEILKFATDKFQVTFDLFSKIDVNGKNASPLWKYLQIKLTGFITNSIKWNFTKFLIDRNGVPLKRYGPKDNLKVCY
ncbi:hypothetical protein A3Q56_06454 [Intoshia linei]|uniref:Glutathione peroxidase n=1 Tax=Intoshia linei TaxID=1819745 RepID=A0A177AV24_9BILA|nr:hypothetical protein A3Q56_06454 [Intoshia linei]